MKRFHLFGWLLVGLFSIALTTPTAGLAAFSNAHLAGTWYIFTFADNPSLNAPDWATGPVTVDSSGTITGGTLIDSNGLPATVTGGSGSLDSNGVMSGSLTLDIGVS